MSTYTYTYLRSILCVGFDDSVNQMHTHQVKYTHIFTFESFYSFEEKCIDNLFLQRHKFCRQKVLTYLLCVCLFLHIY